MGGVTMKIRRKDLDAIIELTKRYWETGDQRYIRKKLNVAERLEMTSGVSWSAWSDFINGLLKNRGIKPNATNGLIYAMFEGLGYEFI